MIRLAAYLWSSLALAALLAGCASTPLLDGAGSLLATHREGKKAAPTPSKYDHLVLHADFELPASHRMIQELVAERELIGERLDLPAGSQPIHLYLFADEADYRRHVAERFPDFADRRAMFVESDDRLSVYAHWGERVAEDLRHETAHGYLHAAVADLPLWLDEGLAEYFEVPRDRRGVNSPHVDLLRGQLAAGDWKPDIKRLESLASAETMTNLDYAESWLWVHWLLETEPPRAELLQTALRELRSSASASSPPLSARLAASHPDAAAQLLAHLAQLAAAAPPPIAAAAVSR